MSRLFLPFAVLTIFQLMGASLCTKQVDQIADTIVVHIISRVPNSPSPLQIHCYNETFDFGKIPVNDGVAFSWEFDQSYFNKTVYNCDFSWASKGSTFEVYDSDGSCFAGVGKEQICYWEARIDGFYFSTDNKSWQKGEDWH